MSVKEKRWIVIEKSYLQQTFLTKNVLHSENVKMTIEYYKTN